MNARQIQRNLGKDLKESPCKVCIADGVMVSLHCVVWLPENMSYGCEVFM
jgi:hypothetical protein